MAHRLEFYLMTGKPLDHHLPWKVLNLNNDELDGYIEEMIEDELCAIFVNNVLEQITDGIDYNVYGVVANVVYSGNPNKVEHNWERRE